MVGSASNSWLHRALTMKRVSRRMSLSRKCLREWPQALLDTPVDGAGNSAGRTATTASLAAYA